MPISVQGGNTPKWQAVEAAISRVIPFKGKSGGSEAIINKVKDIWESVKSLFSSKAGRPMADIRASTTPPQVLPKREWVSSPKIVPEMRLPEIQIQAPSNTAVGKLEEPPRNFDNNREFNAFLRQTGHSEADIKEAIDKNAMKLTETLIPGDDPVSPLRVAIEAKNVAAVKYILEEKNMYLVTSSEMKAVDAAVKSLNLDILDAVLSSKLASRGKVLVARETISEMLVDTPADAPEYAAVMQMYSKLHG